MRPKPEVGQTLYSLNVGNAARFSTQSLTPTIVTSVGRKYFKCRPSYSNWLEIEYHLDDWRQRTEYSEESKLYASPHEWEVEQAASNAYSLIHERFTRWDRDPKLPLSALREIVAIIERHSP